MKPIRPTEYKKYFFSKGVLSCLQCGFLLRGSLAKADLLAVYKDEQFKIFFLKDKEKTCNGLGVEIYTDQKRYEKYFSDFKQYLKFGHEVLVKKYAEVPDHMTKGEFVEVIEQVGKLWWYYGFAEFPYLDLVNEVGDEASRKRAEEIALFKFEARELMNKYYFKDCVIDNILNYISKTFLEGNDAHLLFHDELIALFDGKTFDKEIIEQRKKCYSASVTDRVIEKRSNGEALFLSNNLGVHKPSNHVKGMTAHPGKVKGRVVIAPLLGDHDAIAEIDKIMHPGDILVAETTSPDIMMMCEKAAAIVAEQGGLLSHAAIVSREMKTPCIIQAEYATTILKTGDIVEVDADEGVVRKLN